MGKAVTGHSRSCLSAWMSASSTCSLNGPSKWGANKTEAQHNSDLMLTEAGCKVDKVNFALFAGFQQISQKMMAQSKPCWKNNANNKLQAPLQWQKQGTT